MPAKGLKAKAKAGKAKKGAKSVGYGGERKKKMRKQTWQMYIYKCLKTIYRDMGISSKAMRVMNAFVDDIFERIAQQAVELTKLRKGKTLSAREVQTAIRVILPGELSHCAVLECKKAVDMYRKSSAV